MPRPLPPGEEPSGPEDLYEEKWEVIPQKVHESRLKKPYYRPVVLNDFMRKYGALVKAKMERDYMARAEAYYESLADR